MSELRTNRIVPRDGLPSGSAGGIIQVVSVTKTDASYESVSEGSFSGIVSGLTPTITPTRSDSKILITGYVHAANNAGGGWGAGLVLCADGTPIDGARGDAVGSRARISANADTHYLGNCIPVNFLHSPATTSAITYGVKLYNMNTSTQYMTVNYRYSIDSDNNNHIRSASTLTLMEVSG